ncbi:MAG: thiol peroxidase [Spirochaeta sp.]
MARITFKGNPVNTIGELPKTGSKAPDFLLTKTDLTDVTLADFAGKKKILNIVPSLDTGVCLTSAKHFDSSINDYPDTVVLTVSCDLPFAQQRICKSEHIDRVIPLSQLRSREFGRDYGVEMIDGPLQGLSSRAVVVLDRDNTVLYTEQVPEISHEPDYQKALSAL